MRVVHPSVYLKQKERRKKRKIKKWVVLGLVIFVVGSYGYLASIVQPVYTPSSFFPAVSSAVEVPLSWPTVGNASIGYLREDGIVLAHNNGDSVVPVASTIKLVTALVVLNEKPLGPTEDGERIYFTNADVEKARQIESAGGVFYPVTNGMSMSYREALEVMLVASSNNIALKLAEWSFGTEQKYIESANQFLRTNSITNTTVSDASGLQATTTSTANDLVRITALAMSMPVIREVVDIVSTQVNGIEVINTNTLVSRPDINGVKTGFLPEAGNCLIISSTEVPQGRSFTYIAVVIGQQNRAITASEADRLLADVKNNFKSITLVERNARVVDFTAPWGEVVEAKAQSELITHKWAGEEVSAKTDTSALSEGSKNQEVGTVSARSGEEVAIILSKDLPEPSWWWRLTHALDSLDKIL